MKTVTASATYSETAKKLLKSKDSARETVRGILTTRDSRSGAFVVRGHTFVTERGATARAKKVR